MRLLSVAVAVAVLGAACKKNPPPGDSVDMATPDLRPTPDLKPGPDMAPINTGTLLKAGSWEIVGVTADDEAILLDNTALGAIAQPLAGGASSVTDPAAESVAIRGKVVLSWHNVDPSTNVGKLNLYARTGGRTADIASTSIADVAAATADGAYVLYQDAATGNGGLADFYVVKADGSGARSVIAKAATGAPCKPVLVGAGSRFVVSYCTARSDGGFAGATVASIDPVSGAVTSLATAAKPLFSVDAAATKVLIVLEDGTAEVVPIGGGAATVLDTAVAEGSITDGTSAVYRTVTGAALKRVTTTNPSPMSLVTGGVAGLDAWSPDFNFVVYHGKEDAVSPFTDLLLASTRSAGTPITLSSATTNALGGPFGDSFTSDNSRVLFFKDVDGDLASDTFGTGTLTSQPVGGGSQATHGHRVWMVLAGRGSSVVFGDGYFVYATEPAPRGRVNLKTAADAGTPVLIASHVDEAFALSAGKDKVVYTSAADPARPGLFVAPLP